MEFFPILKYDFFKFIENNIIKLKKINYTSNMQRYAILNFITIFIRRICTSLIMFFYVAKNTCKYINLWALIMIYYRVKLDKVVMCIPPRFRFDSWNTGFLYVVTLIKVATITQKDSIIWLIKTLYSIIF